MRAVLLERELAVAHFEHVRIVPVSGTGVSLQAGLLAGDIVDAVPVGLDVARRPPQPVPADTYRRPACARRRSGSREIRSL
jgi:hypothetical protein